MQSTPLEMAGAIALESIGTLATARWIYHHPAKKPTNDPFSWDWVDLIFSLIVGVFWLPLGVILLIAGAVAWSPKQKAK